jgi:hypothetical protein
MKVNDSHFLWDVDCELSASMLSLPSLLGQEENEIAERRTLALWANSSINNFCVFGLFCVSGDSSFFYGQADKFTSIGPAHHSRAGHSGSTEQ